MTFTKILLSVLLVIGIAIGIYASYNEYGNIKSKNAELMAENIKLADDIKKINAIKEENEKLFLTQLKESQDATKDAMAVASQAEEKFKKKQGELNEVTSQYNALIESNSLRLRDPFQQARNSDSVRGNQGTTENVATATNGSNSESDQGLSKGLSRYLINLTGEANGVVSQLSIVQEYAIEQRKWILQHCNAIE